MTADIGRKIGKRVGGFFSAFRHIRVMDALILFSLLFLFLFF